MLGQELDAASQMEYELESYMTRRQVTQEVLNKFVLEKMEPWRKRVGDEALAIAMPVDNSTSFAARIRRLHSRIGSSRLCVFDQI